MAEKTAQGLIAHARSLLGSPYMWGTYGKIITDDLIASKAKQYPSHYSAAYQQKLRGYIGKGVRAVDCVGLIKAYMMQSTPGKEPAYNAAYDKNVSGMRAACGAKGPIATLPEIPGLLVFQGDVHVGIYLGGGKVIEAAGGSGVLISQLKGAKWTDWGKLSWITYPAGTVTAPAKPAAPAQPSASVEMTVLKPGDRVRFKEDAKTYRPGGKPIHAEEKNSAWIVVKEIKHKGAFQKKGGKLCVLLGEASCGFPDINSWCAVENLEKAGE